MRRALLLASVAVGAPLAGHAQWVVTDPAVEMNTLGTFIKDAVIVENTAKEVINLEQTVSAVAHGNLYAAASLVPQLGIGLPGNPLGGETGSGIADAFMGAAQTAGVLGGAASTVYSAATYYQPTGGDFRALQITSQGQSAASQIALATRMLDSTNQRHGLLQTLFSGISNTADVKAATDATTRVAQEGVTQQNHTNQLLAAQILQHGQQQMREAQEEQMWRCSTENFVNEARAAQAAADSGVVQLISGSPGHCATQASGQPASFTMTADPVSGPTTNDGTTNVSLGTNSGLGSGAGGSMMDQSWGAAAAQNAQAMGVNPVALSAVCQIESNCTNVSNGTSSASGPWQMVNSTYAADLAQAQAQNPGLTVSGGKDDPATQAIAASQDLRNAAAQLQAAGVAAPSVLDTRSYYQFGAAYGTRIAQASPDQSMAALMPSYSQATLTANGVSPGMSVGAWRASVVSKLGDKAYAPVLST